MYGGSTTSILVNVPGEAASVVTCIDGHQMAKKGRAGPALTICAIGSFVAGTIGVFFLMLLAPPLARVALKFGPPEYFAIAFLGLLVLSQMTGRSPLKSYCMMFSGMIIATIGIDPMSGYPRFTLGSSKLLEGIGFMPVIMGLYGVGEVLSSLKDIGISLKAKSIKLKELIPSKVEMKASAAPIVRGGIIGFLMGLIPGPANIISTFVSYGLERKISKKPDEFGKGAIAGFAGPESANNGATAGALVPLLSLGIPFSPLPAVLLAGFMIHGILPGPLLIQNHPTVFWGIIASMYIGNIMLVILNLPLVGIFAQVALIPARILMPLVLVFCFLGAFSFRNSVFDLYILVAFGLIGYFLRRRHYDPSPLVLGIIIGPMIEYSFRQSIIMFGGNYMDFFSRPLSGSILIITIFVFIYPILRNIFKYRVRLKKLIKRQI
jgi:putative tricarboxylic transport membrane protein